MTVLAVVGYPDYYGAGRMFLEAVDALIADGHRVSIVTPESGPLVAEFDKRGLDWDIHHFPVLRKSDLRIRSLAAMAIKLPRDLVRLVVYVRRRRPDTVLVNGVPMAHWLVAGRLAGATTVAYVHEAQEQLPRWFTWLLLLPLHAATRLVANSTATARWISSHHRRLGRRVRVVLNGMAFPEPAREHTPDDPPTILVVGRLNPNKGQHLAIGALNALISTGCESRLRVVGSTFRGYEWYEAELKQLVDRLGLSSAVEFVGEVENVWPEYSRAAAVLVPSSVEALGNVAIEALAMACPIVVTNVGGLPEVVRDKQFGLVVPADNVDALRDGLVWLLGNRDRAHEMATLGREFVRDRFSQERFRRDFVSAVRGAADRG